MSRPTLDDLMEDEWPGYHEQQALEMGAAQMRDALRFVVAWLNGKPTPQGWIIGHGTKEVRAACEAALAAATTKYVRSGPMTEPSEPADSAVK